MKALKQHFIPQFLLKNFANGKKNKEKLWIFDKKEGTSFYSSVKDTGHENRFYEAVNSDSKRIEGEPLTELIDTAGSKFIKRIVESEILVLDAQLVEDVSYWHGPRKP